jgi:hypothetical protein
VAAGAQAAKIMLAKISIDKIVKIFLFIPLSSSRKNYDDSRISGFNELFILLQEWINNIGSSPP